MVLLGIASVILAYLLGSINFAVIFSKVFLKEDVRKVGSGNAGTTNMMRSAGFLPGALTFICDALKGAVACGIGSAVFTVLNRAYPCDWTVPTVGAYICGLACMLGHVFPVFFQFKGGKGVAVSVGIFAICCPPAIVIGLAVFALLVLTTGIVSVGSLVAAITVVSLSIVFNHSGNIYICGAFSFAMGLIVFLKHITNIKRLIRGEEKKITIHKNKG